jgi:protein-S-isoprenylcysteine O-methyltransferase Ste14
MHSLSSIIVICWVVFWLYWLISAFNSKSSATTNMKQARQFFGVRIFIFVLAVILFRVHNVQNYSFENTKATNNELVLTVGFIIFLSGLALAIWARIYLGRNWGMPMTQKQDPELVTSGPYSYIRHPIYTGILLAIVGSVIAGGDFWLVFLVITAPYFIYSAVMEERLMMKQFPKVYPSYKDKTKMLVPFVF